MKKRAFITGGTGFIGINLVTLLVEQGWEVTALHRSGSDLSELNKLPVSINEGSVTNLQSLKMALPQSTEVVFHLAGDTNMWSRHNHRQHQVNVSGTKNMVTAAKDKNVKTFVHTSSVAAWGTIEGIVTESTPQNGWRSWVNYEKTKWAGEQEALKGHSKEMKVVVLNPAAVTGPYDNKNWGRLFLALKNDTLPAIAKGCLSIAHVKPVVQAHLSALEKARGGERYILGGIKCQVKDLVEAITEVSGVDQTPKEIPVWLFKAYGHLLEMTSKFSGNEPTLTPELAKIMTRKNVSFSSKKAINELEYKIPPLKKSVTDCYLWLKKEHLI